MCKGKKTIIFAAGCIALLLIGSVFAYWFGILGHTNKLTADSMNARIVDVFDQGVEPYGTVPLKVEFSNDSSCAAFLRISYAESWEKKAGDETFLLNNRQVGEDVAKKEWTDAWNDSDLWHDGGDGWFYYKKILPPEGRTESVLESIVFPEYTGKYQEYDEAGYQLYFRMELLQASDSQSTLNSTYVNKTASKKVFGKEVAVYGENVSWK